ncbi:MAG: serine hydrolase [Flammeovirgaceae bacterium]|nr:MAG: serine hydrolase [Flammeovirgaceae bacterium]
MEFSWKSENWADLYNLGVTKMNLLGLNYKTCNGTPGKKVWAILALCTVLTNPVFAQTTKKLWVDSVFQTLSVTEKIGQLFIVPVNAKDFEQAERTVKLIENYGIGGVVFTQGGPVGVAGLAETLRRKSKLPLFIGMNAEEGPGNVLDSTVVFPYTLMLGGIRNDSLIYAFGKEIARQLRLLGVNLNFAPTADLSTAFQTDDLIYHTFGEDKNNVSAKASAYMRGLTDGGVIAVVKHYPKYGLVVERFDKGVPVVTSGSINEDDLFVLERLIQSQCPAILTAYQHNPIFPERRKPFTPKNKVVSKALPMLYTADYLKKKTNFQGLFFSYIPDVKQVLNKYRPGDSELYALQAGNDVLLFPENIPATIRRIRKAVKRTPALSAQLDASVKKVLSLKYEFKHQPDLPAEKESLISQLNIPETNLLQHKLAINSVALVKNDNSLLPLANPDQLTVAALSIGERANQPFTEYLSKYVPIKTFSLQQPEDTTGLPDELKKFNVVIAGVFPYATQIENEYAQLLNKLNQSTNLVVCNFTSPSKIKLFDAAPAIFQVYSDEEFLRKLIPQAIFGARPVGGFMPVTISPAIPAGSGIELPPLRILQFGQPEEAGMSSRVLEKINGIAREAIDTKATPGCQVVVVRRGKVVFQQSYGWFTYDNQTAVTNQTIYDLASLTKVSATLQAIMFLHEKGIIDIYKKASVYLPEMQNSNKKDIIIKDILTHQAGLVPFEPWYPLTMKDTTLLSHYYSRAKSDKYPLQVAPNLYAAEHIKDSIWNWTLKSKLITKPNRTPYPFRYSDLSFIILHRLAEKMLNQPLDDFLRQNFYEPLGAYTLGYSPLQRFSPSEITPTEYDKIFRKSMIVGTVHDERAAMLGGNSGHAGLFGNALDLAKLGQMHLQLGTYGRYQYYKPETITLFTNKQFDTSRRGLGWDKPLLNDFASPTSWWASTKTYGHTGFTGTCLWIDPEFDLVYVFLSNRVYPDRNNKLISANIRSRIQDVIYQSIFEYCK